MVDQVKNFVKITVNIGYDASATSIVLSSGEGAELPDPSGDNYNLVWWDSTNYPDPSNDPNVEVIRVTAKSTDTLTVTRNQEGSGASIKNTSGATYKMILAPTAKTITDLQAEIDSDITTHAGLGDAHHAESHTIASHSDTTATGVELETLTDGSDADSLHAHAVNDAKVTNAAHTGDVTGSTALTIAVDAVDIPMLSATGTADATTFLRGDNTWTIPAGSGDVSKVGTPVDNQIGVWTGDGTIEGTSGLTYNGTALDVSGDINIAATKHLVLPLHNDAITPTLAFGDGDSGLYESADDTISIAIAGGLKYHIKSTGIETAVTNGPTLRRETASATNPTLIPGLNDLDTGIGNAAADQLSLIAGGVEGLRITEATGTITNAFTDNITVTGTVDGRDIDTDGTKLDTIDINADITADNPPQTHAMSTHTDEGALATLSTVDTAQINADAVTYDKMQDVSATDKLLGRSTAGAGTVEEIACTAAGRAILDDADNTAQRTTLDVDQAGTDNSTNVTLAGTPNYITIAGQIITRNDVDLTTDITGVLPDENGGTGQSTYAQGDIIYASAADTLAKLAKGIDNHVLTMNGNVPNWEAATAGSQTVNIYLPAESAYLPNTNPAGLVETAGATTYSGFSYLTFDDTTSEHAIWRVPMPDYDGGNIIVKGFTKVATGPGASKTLQFNILTIGLANSEEFDSATTVDTTINLSFSLDIGSASSDIMVASATIDPVNVASDDLLVIELSRDVASDDLSGDGELVGIMLEYSRT